MLAIFKRIELVYDEQTNRDYQYLPSVRIWKALQISQKKWQDSMDMIRFLLHLPSGEATTGKLPFKMRVEEKARDIAEYCGFSQGMCYSFESPKVFDKLLLPADSELRKTVTISNPLGEDFSIMRTTLFEWNADITVQPIIIEETRMYVCMRLGNVYHSKGSSSDRTIRMKECSLLLGMYGDGDFFTMKGVVEEFLESIGMRKKAKYDPNAEKPFLHPGRQANDHI